MSKARNILTRADACLRQRRYPEAERFYRQALRVQPRSARASAGLGHALRSQNKADEAVRMLRRVLDDDANVDVSVCAALARGLSALGRPGEALQVLRNAEPRGAGRHELDVALAAIFVDHGQPDRAVALLRLHLATDTDDLDASHLLARAYTRIGRIPEAIPWLEKIVSTLGKDAGADVWFELADAYRVHGQYDEAIAAYEHVRSSEPNRIAVLAGLADVFESLSRYDEAEAIVDEARQKQWLHPAFADVMGRIARRTGRIDEAIAYMNRLLAQPGIPDEQRAAVLFRQGSLHERVEAYDASFRCFEDANRAIGNRFDEKQHEQVMDAMVDAFAPERFARMPRATNTSERPVFIVGMPRSGTSLVEQILAAHPRVFGAGELERITRLAIDLPNACDAKEPYPECMPDVTADAIEQAATDYLDHLRELGGTDVDRVTDKMPHNFSHLGLINLLCPRARVIHCRRHPLDTCVSCYATLLSANHSYATSLTHLAAAYRAYVRIMSHWMKILDLPVLDVRYEDVVNDQEAQSRRIVEFCGLPWDDACLAFHRSGRLTRTASLDQVKQPIYRSSMQRWKRYEPRIQPLIQALSDLSEAYENESG